MFKISKIFGESPDELKQKDAVREAIKTRYKSFQKLLDSNNQVLETMADMEEKLSGEYLFDMHYIKKNAGLIVQGVLSIVENLNALSKNGYPKLMGVHEEINRKLEEIVEYKMEVPVSDLTIPLEKLVGNNVSIAGGKMAKLGEIKEALNLPVPDGFAISAYAFKRFMDHNRFTDKINEKLLSLDIRNLEELNRFSKEIYCLILESEVPSDLQEELKHAYSELSEKIGRPAAVSVRSSAIREDSEFSFAGQYATFLNVPGDEILQKYKEVIASLFTPRAIFYSRTKGFHSDEIVMSVGILKMINASAGGVMYTRNPNNPEADNIMINAVYGLAKAVVDGTLSSDTYTVSRHPQGAILERSIVNKGRMLTCVEDGGIEETTVPEDRREKPCLTDEQIRALAGYGIILEQYYGSPQDIEWAVGVDGEIYILQSRPLKTLEYPGLPGAVLPTLIEGYNVLLDKGIIASKGVGYGKAFILREDKDLKDFPEGGVLVAKHTNPRYVTVMNRAAAIITDVGSATGHMGSLAREYQVPTILDTGNATSVIQHGMRITVDAINCNVYEGKVDRLIEYALKKKEPFKNTHLFKTLEKVLKWIVPLNLTDPWDEDFRPENCKTFHDITRFSHEMAMQEMFSIGEDKAIEETGTVVLEAGIPINVHMLDLDGGIGENLKKATPEDIYSLPFSAILKGMKGMRWPEPRPADAKGLLGMIAHTATVPEGQLQEMGRSSFAVVSKNYMNFSMRLGYHFSLVEAYAGENINDNFIKFFLKGGGASQDRRLRRVRLIAGILRHMSFRVTIKEDIIDAILTKYKQETIEKRLIILGKMSVYTKQLDMALYNDAITDMYLEQFLKEHAQE